MKIRLAPQRDIIQLPDQLISQIAAGEVVERPASVVKELLENALDAGATEITLRLLDGGKTLVEISDNGCGIHAAQLPLAVTRHATSKIRSLDELEHVESMGFRGEALASIASVSQMRLTSKTDVDAHASSIDNHAGAWQITATAGAVGTRIEVADVYFNTPARRKFLKTEATEFAHCSEVFTRMALASPHCAFKLFHQNKVSAHYPATDWKNRISDVLANTLPEHCIWVNETSGEFNLTGMIFPADAARARADTQYAYVNQRYVRDKVVSHAIRASYADVLMLLPMVLLGLLLTVGMARSVNSFALGDDMARALGADWSYAAPASVMEEIATVAPELFGGIAFPRTCGSQHRNEGLAECAFGKQAPEQVGNAEGHVEGVGEDAGAKNGSYQQLAHQAEHARRQGEQGNNGCRSEQAHADPLRE